MADLVTYDDIVKGLDNIILTPEQIQKLKSSLEVKESGQEKLKDLHMKNGHVMACPYCGKDGKQRYFCKGCHKTFNENVGTLFQHSKLSSEQMYGLIKGMLLNLSLSQIADDTGLSIKSVHFNRKKICNALQELFPEQDKKLTGKVECDEYMARLSFKGKRDAAFFVNVLGRLPKHNRSLAEKLEYLEKNDLLRRFEERLRPIRSAIVRKRQASGKV